MMNEMNTRELTQAVESLEAKVEELEKTLRRLQVKPSEVKAKQAELAKLQAEWDELTRQTDCARREAAAVMEKILDYSLPYVDKVGLEDQHRAALTKQNAAERLQASKETEIRQFRQANEV